jgi:hypothetical protein
LRPAPEQKLGFAAGMTSLWAGLIREGWKKSKGVKKEVIIKERNKREHRQP